MWLRMLECDPVVGKGLKEKYKKRGGIIDIIKGEGKINWFQAANSGRNEKQDRCKKKTKKKAENEPSRAKLHCLKVTLSDLKLAISASLKPATSGRTLSATQILLARLFANRY